MKSIFTVLVIGLLSVWSLGAHAQFGGLGALKGNKSESKDTGSADLGSKADKFSADAALIREAVAYSLLQIQAAVSDKDKIAEAKKSYESLKGATDPKESAAKAGTIIKDTGAEVALALKSEETQEKIKNLSPEMQKKVASSLLAVGIASLKLPKLLEEGQGILQGLSSNMMANMSRIGPLKDGLSSLGEAAPKLPPIVSAGFQLLKNAKVDAVTPTEGAELKVDKDVTFPE
jgi:hypothetical protein